MSNIALYRKYRPLNFNSLVGQDHIRQTLLNAIKGDAISHAYLFCGPRGTGKTTAARLIAKAINCENLIDGREPCGECDFCKDATSGRLIDLIEIDAASNRGIDEIRALREKIKFAPTRAQSKVYIIDEVHMLSKDAFNALLKTLEEPPTHVYFILATTESHKVPETIISRCQRFDFKRVDRKSIVARLGYIAQHEKIEAELDALELIARSVDGGMRDAIGLMEQMTFDKKLTYDFVKESLGITGHKAIQQLYEQLIAGDISKSLATVNDIHFEGYDLSQFTKDFLEFLREKMIDEVKNNGPKLSLIMNMVDRFQEAYEMSRSAVIPQLPLELAVIKLGVPSNEYQVPSEEKAEEDQRSKIKDSRSKTPDQRSKIEEVEPEPKPEENIVSPQQDKGESVIEFSLDSVKRNFPRVLENINTPAIKRSFQTATITKVDGNQVTTTFSTNFHLEKVNNVQGHDVVERAFKQVFGKTVKLNFEFSKVNIKPAFEKSPQPVNEDLEKAVADLGWEVEE
ncbi:MAG: DNA polymerase III subunit gamma/tau [Patescibacteria group bacterium]|nr:DNA polymerase III subunit gamma/tau [Patescibacteria group bacterium]